MHGNTGAFRGGVIVADVDEYTGDEVLRHLVGLRQLVDPSDELVERARFGAVLIGGVRVETATDQFEVTPVDPSAIATNDVFDLESIEGSSDPVVHVSA